MITIQLPDELVEKLQQRGVTNVEAFVTTVLQHLDDTVICAALEPNIEKRIAALQLALSEFRSDITPERWAEVSAAIDAEALDWDEE
jgi:hypothetical protein